MLRDLGEEEWFAEHAEDLEVIGGAEVDFLGVNCCSRHTTAAGTASGAPSANPGSEFVQVVDTGVSRTQMGWEIHPDGLVDVLEMTAAKRPGLALFVTENGAAHEDRLTEDGVHDEDHRADLELHVAARRDALGRGVPLWGYSIWSFMDNFEWACGHTRRFGIVHVDFDTQRRTVKDSGRWVQRFLRTEPRV